MKANKSEFAEQIMNDLIAQGYAGQELQEKFEVKQQQIRPAVERMLAEAEAAARNGKVNTPTLDELFGVEE